MNIDINRIVEQYQAKTGATSLWIAIRLFPDLSETGARQTLSRIRTGNRQKVLTTLFVIRMCELFEISPNEVFDYE